MNREYASLDRQSTDELCIATIRTLAMDAVEQAGSGHPGTPMALAPAAYLLWQRFLRHDPRDPQWPDRDRFILSNGHASMLLYALLHLTGYDLSLDDLKGFRQWGSKTPGHPEYRVTPGAEITTGPLGQGFLGAVGMALAEAHLAARYNRDGHTLFDHYTYVFCSDGDLMEGASHEAASLAGHLGLAKLIVLYDDNRITIDGATEIAYSEDVPGRFSAYGWQVQDLGAKANDLDVLAAAYSAARRDEERPSLIALRSHIAFGAPNLQDDPAAHGAPLGEDEVRRAKASYGWPPESRFLVPERAMAHMHEARERGARLSAEWRERLAAYREALPEQAAELERALAGELPAGWADGLPEFPGAASGVATRAAGGKVLNHFARRVPFLVGGAADLASSTKAAIDGEPLMSRGDYRGRNIAFGVREHAMCGVCSGLALHGGLRPFASTFLIFTDYARPAMRLAALMELPVIYVMTHDSIGLGEDGPTHQPVEHLASFRAMPNMCVVRPGDANEVVYAWQAALARRDGPTLLVLSRQGLPVFDRGRLAPAAGVLRGAYVLSPERDRPDLVVLASGSELHLAVAAQGDLATRHGIDARVVSMPSWELFRAQSPGYRDDVLPPGIPRLAVEAGAAQGWCEWVGERGRVIGMERFGASAPGADLFRRFGFSVDHVVEQASALMG